MKRKMIAAVMAGVLTASLLTGCTGDDAAYKKTEGGTHGGQETSGGDLSGTLTFAIWDNNLNDFIESNDMVGKFQEKYPDVEIEVEKIKDDSEYWNAMKMRASANQLPDVMFNKTFTLSRFKDYLIDLSDTEACKNNELAEGYAVDGKVLGIPMTSGYEYVYYWKDMFKEAGVEVPTTWTEFEDTAKSLQDYFSKDNADFMAIACGLKDEWPDYPYMEFMPALESGNGQNWNTMAETDEPFAEGTDIYKAYTKVNELFSSGVLGKTRWDLETTRQLHCLHQRRQRLLRWVTGDCRISRITRMIHPSWEHFTCRPEIPHQTRITLWCRGIRSWA